MAGITGGELLLKCLKQEGIQVMFGVLDGSFNPFLAKLDEYDIRFVNPRHEAAAAHMAEAWSRVRGEPAVVIGGIGPGAANMVSGVVTAYAEGQPADRPERPATAQHHLSRPRRLVPERRLARAIPAGHQVERRGARMAPSARVDPARLPRGDQRPAGARLPRDSRGRHARCRRPRVGQGMAAVPVPGRKGSERATRP